MSRRPLFIGLTGAVGSGKSEVARCLRELGVPVFSADREVHRQLRRPPVVRRLFNRWGAGTLDGRGRLDRAQVAVRVFRDARERRWLEGVLHPLVRREVAAWWRRLSRRRRRPLVAVAEIPLLHESGWGPMFHGVLCVSASDLVRRRRLRDRGWSPSMVRARERAQWSPRRKARASQWRIDNDGDLRMLKVRVRDWRRAILRRDE